MPTNDADLQAQARSLLDEIAFIPFEQLQPLNRAFDSIPARPSIYAVRHKTDGLQPFRCLPSTTLAPKPHL
jgi:hypothetical protein